jgi:RimJ/RimL family protein N-acetyltransferase
MPPAREVTLLMSPTITTERLLLEPYVPGDVEDFVALFTDEDVSRWMGDGPESEENNRAVFDRIFSHVYPNKRFDIWAVRENGRFVGHAEIKDTTDIDGFEIIYALARHAWGRGLGTELAARLVAYGFEELNLTEVHATVHPDNPASLAALGKVGFHVTDTIEDDSGRTVVLTCRREDQIAG